jgi:hypothetical protein
MKALCYLLTFIFGFLGVGTAARAIEVVAHGSAFPTQSVFGGFICLLLALLSLHKARGQSAEKN